MDIILRECKKRLRFKAFKISAILLLIIVGIIGYEGFVAYNFFTGPKDFDDFYERIWDVDESTGKDAIEKQYISSELQYMYEPYASYYTTKDGIKEKGSEEYYYLLPLEEDYYITVQVQESEKELYDKLVQESYDYMDAKTDKLPGVINFKGGFHKGSVELMDQATQYFKESGFDIDTNGLEYYLSPYIIQSGYVNNLDIYFIYIFMITVGVLIICIIGAWIGYFSSKNVRAVRNYLEQLSNEDNNIIQLDYEKAIRGKRIALGEKWCYNFHNMNTEIIAYEDMVWMYMKTISHRTNGIPTGKTRSIMLYDGAGGKSHTLCEGASEAKINEILEILYQKQPNMFVGYSDQNQALFRKDFKQMADIALAKTNKDA